LRAAHWGAGADQHLVQSARRADRVEPVRCAEDVLRLRHRCARDGKFSRREACRRLARDVRRPELDMKTLHLASANAPRSGSEWLTSMRRLTQAPHFREHFSDALHLRLRSYPVLAQIA